ncbi:hypothetical protein [Streptomyces sp. NPDC059452]|uniref:hypothetical protein n=1 Tax=Streptomyces sp. NPDC059452 TaxID=3346835 RepID=UPI0036B742EC
MKDRIGRVMSALLSLVLPLRNGRRAVYRHTVSPSRARDLHQALRSPWLEPWPGPDSATVRQHWADDERDMTIPLRGVTGDLRRAHDAEGARRSRFEHRRSFDQAAAYPDEVDLHQERRRALSFAASGYDYPYSYPGAPFPSSAIGLP